MNRAALGTIAILWRGDRTTRRQATPQNNRFHRIFEELASLGLRAEPAVYDETFADEVHAQLLQAEGVLVWVNPLQDGKTRYSLDTRLREVAAHGPWVSAHPDTILRMGTKEVLVRTRHLGWGIDTQLYESMPQLRDALTARLAAGVARVLKQNRGNDGQGVWKVEPPLPAESGDPENAGHRAPARRQDGSDQQHLGMPPTSLEKERRKAEDHRGEAGWHSEHGGAPVAGTPQPSRSPASLPRARKWPNSRLARVWPFRRHDR